MRSNLLVLYLLAGLTALNTLAPSATADAPDSACGIGSPIAANCATATHSIVIHYDTCIYGREVNPGIWEAYCETTQTISVTASGWITSGSWVAHWGGWCADPARSWTIAGDTYTVSCDTWPVYAARCDNVFPTTSRTMNIYFSSGVASLPPPRTLYVYGSAARPPPPAGVC